MVKHKEGHKSEQKKSKLDNDLKVSSTKNTPEVSSPGLETAKSIPDSPDSLTAISKRSESTKYSSTFEDFGSVSKVSKPKSEDHAVSPAQKENSVHSPGQDTEEIQRYLEQNSFEHTSSNKTSDSDSKSVKEVIISGDLSDPSDSMSESFPILRQDPVKDVSLRTVKSGKIDEQTDPIKPKSGSDDTSDHSRKTVTFNSGSYSQQQSTSAGDNGTGTTTSKTNDTAPGINKRQYLSMSDIRNDISSENSQQHSEKDDKKYESAFETEKTENTDSMIESSVLEMSFNESNLNYSYSTVGRVSQFFWLSYMVKIFL